MSFTSTVRHPIATVPSCLLLHWYLLTNIPVSSLLVRHRYTVWPCNYALVHTNATMHSHTWTHLCTRTHECTYATICGYSHFQVMFIHPQCDASSRKRYRQQSYRQAQATFRKAQKIANTSPWTWDATLSQKSIFFAWAHNHSCILIYARDVCRQRYRHGHEGAAQGRAGLHQQPDSRVMCQRDTALHCGCSQVPREQHSMTNQKRLWLCLSFACLPLCESMYLCVLYFCTTTVFFRGWNRSAWTDLFTATVWQQQIMIK